MEMFSDDIDGELEYCEVSQASGGFPMSRQQQKNWLQLLKRDQQASNDHHHDSYRHIDLIIAMFIVESAM